MNQSELPTSISGITDMVEGLTGGVMPFSMTDGVLGNTDTQGVTTSTIGVTNGITGVAMDNNSRNVINNTQIARTNNKLLYNNSRLTPEFLKNEFSGNRSVRFIVSNDEFIKPSDGDPLSGTGYGYFSLVTSISNRDIKDNTSEFFF
jgi:hypothetical protein